MFPVVRRHALRYAQVARRSLSVLPPPFLVEQWEGWESGKYVLSNSDCEPIQMTDLLEMADEECKERWSSLNLGYGHQLGCPLLRDDIVKYYFERGNVAITPSDLNVVVPAEGIFLAMTTLLQPSDHCVVTTPSYQSLHQLAESKGCEVSKWSPSASGGKYHFDVDRLISMIKPSTRMVVLNFPHNPTGGTITVPELQSIVDACRSNDTYLFMDEMYKYLEHPGVETLPSVATLYEKGITLGGVSKWGSLAGIRIGWLATKDDYAKKEIARLKDYTTISSSRPSEVLASIGLRNKTTLIHNNLDIINEGKTYLHSFVRSHPDKFEWLEPAGGSFSFIKLLGSTTASSYVKVLAEEADLCVMPSELFVDAGDKSLRICFGRKGTTDMIERWRAVVENN
mmetsp:Transcript_18185/g.37848  ORF Transcript_18185/g.37848 Transcript_18185/m.37848 type:complete len:397 (+) Transcript_18185:162-1352(+)